MDCSLYKITLLKNEDRFFSYTDRLSSYLMLHISDRKKSDGFICKDELIFSDFYLLYKGKKITRYKAEATELYGNYFIIYFKNPDISIKCFLPEKSGFVTFEIENHKNTEFKFVLFKEKEIVKTVDVVAEKIIFNSSIESSLSQDELKKIIEDNHKLWQSFEERIRFFTGNPEVDKALYWSMVSGYNLCTGETEARGIWAGLPWFRDNWGRDTFIALPGILLVNGNFSEAKNIIRCFARYQDVNADSPTYGRIPNRYRNASDVLYNTVDGNLWFIISLWEYGQYTGDFSFVNEMWETVKLAVKADLKLRTDENGFLVHGDADTWMDARFEGKQALSPRGNRANDIQALWYKSLNIYLKLCELTGDKDNYDAVKNTSEKIKQKFKAFYWNDSLKKLADCLHKDGTKDFSVRPNQLFCITQGNELLSIDEELSVIKSSMEKLCLPYGVMSLSYEDENFHPFHDGCKMYHKDAAYHNGAIWLWNSGVLVSALCKYGYQNYAWKLTENHVKQINDICCAGTLSENINAMTDRKGNITPTGTWSQAWSVSEFSRSFYQDYLGVHPMLLENKISIKPCIPNEWVAGCADVYVADGFITISWGELKNGQRSFSVTTENEKLLQLPVELYTGNKVMQIVVSAKNPVKTNLSIFSNPENLNFARLPEGKKYKSLKIKNYLFDKVRDYE